MLYKIYKFTLQGSHKSWYTSADLKMYFYDKVQGQYHIWDSKPWSLLCLCCGTVHWKDIDE